MKAFALAKGRLAGVLDDRERAALARRCAAAVVASAGDWPVYVVTGAGEVADWAESTGARVVPDPGGGLDAAVAAGRGAAVSDGADHVVIAHGDLPLARTLAHVVVEGAVTIVPDRHRDGTNVLALPADCPLTTSYGPGSFDRHCALVEAAGLVAHVVDDRDLALDLDTADDLTEFAHRTGVAR